MRPGPAANLRGARRNLRVAITGVGLSGLRRLRRGHPASQLILSSEHPLDHLLAVTDEFQRATAVAWFGLHTVQFDCCACQCRHFGERPKDAEHPNLPLRFDELLNLLACPSRNLTSLHRIFAHFLHVRLVVYRQNLHDCEGLTAELSPLKGEAVRADEACVQQQMPVHVPSRIFVREFERRATSEHSRCD